MLNMFSSVMIFFSYDCGIRELQNWSLLALFIVDILCFRGFLLLLVIQVKDHANIRVTDLAGYPTKTLAGDQKTWYPLRLDTGYPAKNMQACQKCLESLIPSRTAPFLGSRPFLRRGDTTGCEYYHQKI